MNESTVTGQELNFVCLWAEGMIREFSQSCPAIRIDSASPLAVVGLLGLGRRNEQAAAAAATNLAHKLLRYVSAEANCFGRSRAAIFTRVFYPLSRFECGFGPSRRLR